MLRPDLIIAAVSVAACTCVAAVLYVYWDDPIGSPRTHERNKTAQRFGGQLPIVGDAFTILSWSKRFHEKRLDSFERLGNATKMVKLPFQSPRFFANDPLIVEFVLKTKFDSFEKGMLFHNTLKDLLGNGIFNSDGETWRKQRKTAAQIFNVTNFKNFVNDVFSDRERKLSAILSQHAATHATFDLSNLLFCLTFDTFAEIAFGFPTEALTSSKNIHIMNAFDSITSRLVGRFFNPLWKLTELMSSEGSKHARELNIIREFGMRVIEEKLERNSHNNDLLSLFMQLEDEDGQKLSDDALIDHVLNFLLAGRDTTACTLSWIFFMVHQNPQATARLREEITAVLHDATPTYEQVKHSLPYATAFVHETLRLYPGVPVSMKEAVDDIILPDGTFMPAGASVGWSSYTLGRTEAIWGPDAKVFRPERWLESEKQPSPFDYPVFNAGPRVCLGKHMAELQMVYLLVELARKFDFEVADEASVTYGMSLTLPMKNGLPVQCRSRVF